MNKHNSSSILNTFFLIAIALSSGCGAVTAIPSPTLTTMPSQTPIATVTPSPTNTPEPIYPKGTIYYSDSSAIYSIDVERQVTKVLLKNVDSYLIADNFIYKPSFSKKSNAREVFRISLDGNKQEQLTSDGVWQVFNVDPVKHYLAYNNQRRELVMLNLENNTTQVIAKPEKNAKGSEWIFAKSWSPAGKKLIYSRVLNPATYDICTLFIYDINTKTSEELLPNFQVDCIASWSPDGRKIALTSSNDQHGELYILNLESNTYNQIPVEKGYVHFSGLAWFSNGEKLLIGANEKIYLYSTKDDNLEVTSTYSDLTSSFISSPNKNMTLYEQPNRTKDTGLYLFNIAEEKTKKIYSHTSILQQGKTLDSVNWHYSAVWSPDGKYFAYFTTSEPDNYSRKWPRPITLNIYSVETGNSISFEVPTKSGYMVFGTYWVYPKQQPTNNQEKYES